MPVIASQPMEARDYFAMPETNERYELFEGRLRLAPAPELHHQEIVFALARAIDDFARQHGGRVIVSPTDVELSPRTVLQPDTGYVGPGSAVVAREHLSGAPDLVVEVLSTGTRRYDTNEKLRIYAVYGVREAWIVDPRDQSVTVHSALNGRWAESATVEFGETIPSRVVSVGDGGLDQFRRS
jgi:Uma2 family endonuclease